MARKSIISGYASPFGQCTFLPGLDVFEEIAPGAFDRFLNSNHPTIAFRWGSHDVDAPVLGFTGQNAGLFADAAGLAFWLEVDATYPAFGWSATREIAAGLNQASVNLRIVKHRDDVYGGYPRSVITEAEIAGHITIGTNQAAYRDFTGVWLRDYVSDAPHHIRMQAAQWDAGWAAHLDRIEAAHRREQAAWQQTVAAQHQRMMALVRRGIR